MLQEDCQSLIEVQQPESFKESDEEDIENYPDDGSAGSTSSNFEVLVECAD